MIDYDKVEYKTIIEHLLHIQKMYNLSDIYVIETTHGFNAICLDKLPIAVINDIGTSVLSPADRDFFKYGFKRGYFVIRFDWDKKLLDILKSNNNIYEKSQFHKDFLEWFFKITIRGENWDENKKGNIVQYPSNKNGYHFVEKNIPENYIETLKRLRK